MKDQGVFQGGKGGPSPLLEFPLKLGCYQNAYTCNCSIAAYLKSKSKVLLDKLTLLHTSNCTNKP